MATKLYLFIVLLLISFSALADSNYNYRERLGYKPLNQTIQEQQIRNDYNTMMNMQREMYMQHNLSPNSHLHPRNYRNGGNGLNPYYNPQYYGQ